MHVPKKGALALGLVVALSFATACSSSPDTESDDTFVVAIPSNPPHFNMGITTDAGSTFVSRAIFEPLVHLNQDYEIEPGLAQDWEMNQDATEFTFHLVEGVSWHDGEGFSSEDVAFYFDEVMSFHPLGAQIDAVYDSTETPDELTAVVRLSEPFAPLVQAMSAHAMLPAHLYAGTDLVDNDTNLNPVGTGPFEFESYVNGDSVTVVRNDDYWGEQGGVDTIIYRIMPDANARSLALQSGDVDLAIRVPVNQLEQLEQDDRLQFESATMAEHLYAFFNTRNEIIDDSAVRAALYRAIDRDGLADRVFMGTGSPSTGVVPNQVSWALDPSVDYTDEFSYDLESAAAMLDDAGYLAGADGTRFTIRLNVMSSEPLLVSAADLLRSNLDQIGVRVDVTNQDSNVFAEETFIEHNFDLTLVSLGAFADPSLGVARAFVCNPDDQAFRNPTGVCDDALDGAFERAALESSDEERVAAFAEAAQANSEILGTLPLISYNQVESYRAEQWDGVENFVWLDRWDWSALEPKQ